MASMIKSGPEIQEVFLNFMLSNPSLFTRVQNIYNVENFDRSLRPAAKFLYEHVKDHNSIPTTQQINAVANTKLEIIEGINDGHESWFLEEFEQFTRIEEMERAILKSADLLEKGDFGPIEKLIKDAVQISLTRDLGINYFENPRARLMKLKESNGQVSTGWRDVDHAIFGGFNRGELEIFCGLPSAGKSLILQNLSLNWALSGLNGIYITLELSRELVAMRLDSMITGICSKEIFKRLDDVELQVTMTGKKSGRLKIKYLPAGSTVNDIKSYVKELMIKENYKPDFLCVDYMDLVNPGAYKVDQADFFTKDKLVSEELRNYAVELKMVGVTASQINRSGDGEIEFSYTNIAGGISKINTVDNLFGIFTSRSMKERGLIQLQLMKTRNSSGVGQKIDLAFNVDSLRITDSDISSEDSTNSISILSQIKNGPKTTIQTSSNENKQDLLKGLLKTIGNKT